MLRVFIIFGIMFFSVFFLSAKDALAVEKGIAFEQDFAVKGKTEGNENYEIDDIIPEISTRHSYIALFFIDLLPGGGHFYQEKYYLGFTFATLKILGAFSLYYFYRDLGDKKSEYYDAKRESEFFYSESYGVSEGTVLDYKRDYDEAQQHVTLTVLGNIAVYISSFLISYINLKKKNEKSIPTFELQYSCDMQSPIKVGVITFRFNLRV